VRHALTRGTASAFVRCTAERFDRVASALTELQRRRVRAWLAEWMPTFGRSEAARALACAEESCRERRACRACGALKLATEFTSNQWRRAPRRCRDCCTQGRERAVEQDDDAEHTRRHLEECLLQEKACLDTELSRRNAHERRETECPICFEDVVPSHRVLLHTPSDHWVCAECMHDFRQHRISACLKALLPLNSALSNVSVCDTR
jgi:hypothetical protein